jgi:uncharacterized protein YbjT (DUF2867 family)
VDVGEVADCLAELALSGRPCPDLGDPQVRTMASLARAYLKVAGRRKRILEVPLPGKTARTVRDGAHVTQAVPGSVRAKITWEEFLCRTMAPKNR